jgi:hypothetical protein
MEESKRDQLAKIAERLPYLPNLSLDIWQYRKLYKKAKRFYKNKWRGQEQPSPAFGGKIVHASNYGWRHIGKTVTSTYSDVIKRLNHLPNAKQILEKADFIYETIKEVDKHQVINRHVLLGKLENGEVLKVIVKEIDNRLIFVSVYDAINIKKG